MPKAKSSKWRVTVVTGEGVDVALSLGLQCLSSALATIATLRVRVGDNESFQKGKMDLMDRDPFSDNMHVRSFPLTVVIQTH